MKFISLASFLGRVFPRAKLSTSGNLDRLSKLIFDEVIYLLCLSEHAYILNLIIQTRSAQQYC